jgi:hypothetical protein
MPVARPDNESPYLMKKKMHFLAFAQHGVINHAIAMWAHPRDKVGYDYARPDFWQDLGRLLERGYFDAIFLADEQASGTDEVSM